MKFTRSFALALVFALVVACGEKTPQQQDDGAEAQQPAVENKLSFEEYEKIIAALPDHHQLGNVYLPFKVSYDSAVMHDIKDAGDFPSDYAAAMGMGLYSADMAYHQVYERDEASLGSLRAISELADRLGVDYPGSPDSLPRPGSYAFDLALKPRLDEDLNLLAGNFYMKGEESKILALLLGYWAETMYFTAHHYQELSAATQDNVNAKGMTVLVKYEGQLMSASSTGLALNVSKEVYENPKFHLAEQRGVISKLSLLLPFFSKDDPDFKQAIDGIAGPLGELKRIYDEVMPKENPGVKPGGVEDNERESWKRIEMQISEENLQRIRSLIEKIRASIIATQPE